MSYLSCSRHEIFVFISPGSALTMLENEVVEIFYDGVIPANVSCNFPRHKLGKSYEKCLVQYRTMRQTFQSFYSFRVVAKSKTLVGCTFRNNWGETIKYEIYPATCASNFARNALAVSDIHIVIDQNQRDRKRHRSAVNELS